MRKFTSVLLAAIMVLSMLGLAACNNGSVPTETSGAGETETTAASGDTTAAADTTAAEEETTAPAAETDATGYEVIPDAKYHGAIGLGTWLTAASFDSVTVKDNRNGNILYSTEFENASDLEGWTPFTCNGGDWTVNDTDWAIADGALNLSNKTNSGCAIWYGNPNWTHYTLSVKATATEGSEGILIFYNYADENNYDFLNLGGWGNTNYCVQRVENGTKTIYSSQIPFSIEYGRQYTIDIRVNQTGVTYIYLDGMQICTLDYEFDADDQWYGTVGLSTWNTSAMYKNLKVTSLADGSVLYENALTSPDCFADWTAANGVGGNWSLDMNDWVIGDAGAEFTNASCSGGMVYYNGGTNWHNYKMSFDAMKTGGAEVFIIPIALRDTANYVHWNLGGWNNTKTCFETVDGGAKTAQEQLDDSYVTDQWYHVDIIITDYALYGYVDGTLLQVLWK